MAITYTWEIPNTEFDLPSKGITIIHWRCTGSETVGSGDDAVTYTATSYGTTSHTYDADADDFVAYNDVDESVALGWCQAQLDQAAIEAAIAAQINEDKTPTTGSGVPW